MQYGITSLPSYMGGGYLDEYGRQQYGLGKLVKSITKPVAKVLDKIVPNEIKPALPFIAAATPFMLGPSFSFGGLTPEMSRAIAAAGANVLAQSSQEGADKYGINPISVGLSGLGGYLSTPGVGDSLRAGTIVGNVGDTPITQGMITAGQGIPTSTNLSFLQSAENLARNVASYGADTLSKGTTAFQDIIGGTSANVGKDLITLGKAAIPGQVTAVGDLAYFRAAKALDEYDQQQKALGAMGVASTEARRAAVIRAMGLSEFTEPEIQSALTRLGLRQGGITQKKVQVPISLDGIAKEVFNDTLDNLTYTQKETVYEIYQDRKDKKAKGGIMNLGGLEMDLRAKGGFIPIGAREKADDVPARLSKNEFVFTAKAVKGAGKGDIRKGAKRMYQLMKQYEAVA